MKRLMLIRHAERPDIPKNEVGNDVLLTAHGKKTSVDFASALTVPVVSIRSSPVLRCVETADLMAKTINYPSDQIKLDHNLGDPGFIIDDEKKAWRHWQAKGHDAVNQHLLSGSEPWSGFTDLGIASRNFADMIQRELVLSKSGLHLWVTHDTILAAFTARMLENGLTSAQWPHFLGYLDITLKNNKLSFNYNSGFGLT